jgi:hypothetical protein
MRRRSLLDRLDRFPISDAAGVWRRLPYLACGSATTPATQRIGGGEAGIEFFLRADAAQFAPVAQGARTTTGDVGVEVNAERKAGERAARFEGAPAMKTTVFD